MPLNHDCTSSADCCNPQPSLNGQHRSARQVTVADKRTSSPGSSLINCVYIVLRCSRCGELRQARAELPQSSSVACPECARDCTFVLLASGLTTKSLPFHEGPRVKSMRWDRWMSDLHDSS
jgi:hypothetical protein